jgi:hypothetical protein
MPSSVADADESGAESTVTLLTDVPSAAWKGWHSRHRVKNTPAVRWKVLPALFRMVASRRKSGFKTASLLGIVS